MESEAPQVSFDQLLSYSSDEVGPFHVARCYPPMPQYGGFEPSTLMNTDTTHSISTSPSHASMPLPIFQPLSSIPIKQPPSPEAGALPDPIPTSALLSPSIAPFRKTSTGGPKPRKILTGQARHEICLYYEQNKGITHAEIGFIFGVERSTITKVLLQKAKYLGGEDGGQSPAERTKGQIPDIENALSNWTSDYQQKGLPLSDEVIMNKVLLFAKACRLTNGEKAALTKDWLEKFKEANNLRLVDHSPICAITEELSLATIPESPLKVGKKKACTDIERNTRAELIEQRYHNPETNIEPHSAVNQSNCTASTSACRPPKRDEAMDAIALVMRYFKRNIDNTGLNVEEEVDIDNIMKRLKNKDDGFSHEK
ncbi:hypothetical protein N7536_000118 [Penicillium majusculum]|nr:hypothetical protein N7536_000118 [Penicillium majusculum]